MAVYSTKENGKDKYLSETLFSLLNTVPDLHKKSSVRLFLSVNGYTAKTKDIIEDFSDIITGVIYNDKNLGTAEAINKIWHTFRLPGENAIKMDDDVYIYTPNWVDILESAVARDPHIGIIGLKRNDCTEHPYNPNPQFKSELMMLPHKPGERHITVEKVQHLMGTCQLYSSALLDKIGYLYQPGLYGFDDSLASVRSTLSGFINAFACNVYIDHIDPGTTPYQKWKEQSASKDWVKFHAVIDEYKKFPNKIYYNPFI